MADDHLDEVTAREIRDAVGEAFRSFASGGTVPKSPPVVAIPEDKLREIIRDEGRRDWERHKDGFSKDILRDTQDAMRKMFKEEIDVLRSEFYTTFADIGMPLTREDDKRQKTAEKLRDLFHMRDASKEWKSDLWKAIRQMSIGSLLAAMATAWGFLTFRGGSSH